MFGDLFVGLGTTISTDSMFNGTNRFGTENIIGSDCMINGVTAGDTVEIQSGCAVTNSHLEDGAKILEKSSISGATIKKGAASVGPSAMMGNGSTLYPGKGIGEGSCVGANVEVKVNIPAKSYMNLDMKIKKIPSRKLVMIYNGVCITQK